MSPRTFTAGLIVVWILTAVAVRIVLHRRATGNSGVNRLRKRSGSMEWVSNVLFMVSLLVLCAGAVSQQTREWSARSVVGAGLATTLGAIATFVSQSGLGDSWRIGVDQNERTTLRTDGWYAHIRNPIFTAMIITVIGITLVMPSLITVLATMAFILSIELIVRFVEEPYLLRTHGDSFVEYCARTGRFVEACAQQMITL